MRYKSGATEEELEREQKLLFSQARQRYNSTFNDQSSNDSDEDSDDDKINEEYKYNVH